MMKHHIPILFLFLLAVLSCGDNGKSESEIAREAFTQDSAALKIAVTPTLDCLPVFVADEEGLFQECGVSVRLRLYQAQMDQDTAMIRGRVEAMTTDLVRAEWMRREGTMLRYVAATPLSWQLVSNPPARIKQLSQMDDKMLAMTRHSATDMLSLMVIDSVRLDRDRVFRIQVNDVSVRLNMLLSGVMDAMWLPEPQATIARNSGSPMIYDSRGSGMQMGVVAFSEEALADTTRQSQMSSFIEAYNMACDTINSRGLPQFAKLLGRICGVNAELLDSLPDNISFQHASQPSSYNVERAKAWISSNR